MKALKLLIIVAALAIFGCAGVERQQDKCMREVLEVYAQDVERLDENRGELGFDDYAHLTKLYARGLDRRAKSCIW